MPRHARPHSEGPTARHADARAPSPRPRGHAQAQAHAHAHAHAHARAPRLRHTASVLGAHVIAVLAIVLVGFALPRTMPGDPLAALGGADADLGIDPQAREEALAFYGLDQPLGTQLVDHLTGLLHGDLGWSLAHGVPVAELLAQHLPWTFGLAGLALLLSSVLALVAGAAAAWWRGRPLDRALVSVLTGLRAIPEYVVASALLIAFAVVVPVLPTAGGQSAFVSHPHLAAALADLARHGALPLAALTVSLLGGSFLVVRGSVARELDSEHLALARAKGLPPRLLAGRHAARGALIPFLAGVGVRASLAVGGAVFVEAVFSYPGMGLLILDAVEARDHPVLEGAFLVLALSVLVVNGVVEIVADRLDPRGEAKAA